jgi:BASS family bile acid:Na+ symporter
MGQVRLAHLQSSCFSDVTFFSMCKLKSQNMPAGFVLGYAISKALGLSDKIARTNSIEVGMQNATLGAVLAGLHFSDPLVAAPCAVSSCTQSVLGSLIAAYFSAPVENEES